MRALRIALALVLTLAAPAAAGHPWTPSVLTIDPGSLQRVTEGRRPVSVVDVRPAEAYERGRLPGARSIPLNALILRQGEIPSASIVVLYGADSVDEAAAAYRYLRAAGRDTVFVLEGGFAGWQAGGYRVER
jgi:rhodanese-related sulfurtransferase